MEFETERVKKLDDSSAILTGTEKGCDSINFDFAFLHLKRGFCDEALGPDLLLHLFEAYTSGEASNLTFCGDLLLDLYLKSEN